MGRRRCGLGPAGLRRLSRCWAEENGIVVFNPDRQTMEMGLFAGASVHILQNDPKDHNMVVAVGCARYAISRQTADQIMVK